MKVQIKDFFYSKTMQIILDATVFGSAWIAAYLIRFEGVPSFTFARQCLLWLPCFVLLRLYVNWRMGIHRFVWKYASLSDAVAMARSLSIGSLLLLGLRLFYPSGLVLAEDIRVPVGVIVIEYLLSLTCTLGMRALRRIQYQGSQRSAIAPSAVRRLLLVGAGEHGATVAKEMLPHKGLEVVGFVDDDPGLLGAVVAGVRVLGPTTAIPEITKKHRVDEVLLCVPPTQRSSMKLSEKGKGGQVRTRIVPTIAEILQERGASSDDLQSQTAKQPGARTLPEIPQHPSTSLRGKTILITGGAGFIGSNLAEKLAPTNKVILFDTDFRGRPVQFTSLLYHPNVRTLEGSIVDGLDLEPVCRDVDMVVHAAAIVGVGRVCGAARETLETNYLGTSRLLKALEGNRHLERFLYFSTSEVFGVNSYRVDENSRPSVGPIAESRWSYAIAKLAGEHLVESYFRETKMPVVIVRPFNVFGPRRTGEHALLRFIVNALAAVPLEVHGDGSQIRSWCYIEDFCAALVQMLERPAAVGEDFNVGNPGNTVTIYELARKVVEIANSSSDIRFVEHPFPDVSIRVPSLTKAETLLGYRPRYDLDSALTLTIDWYRRHWDIFVEPARRIEAAPAIRAPRRVAKPASPVQIANA